MNVTFTLLLMSLMLPALALCAVVWIPLSVKQACRSGGPSWTLTNPNNATALSSVGGAVKGCCFPGNVYSHLQAAGVLSDPLYRFNDVEYLWVAKQAWKYEYDNVTVSSLMEFATNLNLFHQDSVVGRVELVVRRAKVFANVSVNVSSSLGSSSHFAEEENRVVGETASEFVEYAFNVTALLKSPLEEWAQSSVNVSNKSNVTTSTRLSFSLYFSSTLERAIELNNTYSLKPFPTAPEYLGGQPGRNFVRTEQSSFGWDWGPAFVPIGVAGDIGLRVSLLDADTRSQVGIHVVNVWPQLRCGTHSLSNKLFYVNMSWNVRAIGASICQHSSNSTWCVRNLSLFVSSPSLSLGTTNFTAEVTFRLYDEGVWEGAVSSLIDVRNPSLWYPRGYGDQPRHIIHGTMALLCTDISTELIDVAATEWELPTPLAIRCIALKTTGNPQEHVTSPPTRFAPNNISNSSTVADHVMFFSVNGKSIFAKGANVIPPTALPNSDDDENRLRRDLESALAANMNMIRIWGGGYYPSDWVYAFCDQHGLLVWQEFIFACSEYPVDSNFLKLVRMEIAQQVMRLAAYSSIVLWSANNENDVYDKGPSAEAYHILYTENVLDIVTRYDTSRPLWPSSPAEGFLRGVDENGLPNGMPFVVDRSITSLSPRGDSHYYNYFSCPDVSAYPRTHFASEFGFQSLPWIENLMPISESSDWSLYSPFMEHRQRHSNGNAEIAQLIARNFFNNNLSEITSLLFSRLVFLSQLQQALCITDQISFYRRGRDYPAYRTMGALYWQLNQNWQAPSWTSIEFGGEWKVLHYGVRQAFEEVHLSSFVESGTFFLHLSNDNTYSLRNVTTHLFLVNYSDGAAQKLSTTIANVTRNSGAFLWSGSFAEVEDRFLWAETTVGNVVRHHFASIGLGDRTHKNCAGLINITLNAIAFNTADLSVSLNVDHVVTHIFVRSTKYVRGTFSENLFHLIPCGVHHCVGSSSLHLQFTNPVEENLGGKRSFLESIAAECK